MTEEQKKKLHEALMETVGVQLEPGSTEWRLFDESASEDIRKLEPLIDAFLLEAWRAGAAEGVRKILLEEQQTVKGYFEIQNGQVVRIPG